ncbi:hypothetical protein ACFVFS_17620 [Kitasatospora sp. NPDC057692]|uniref:hypothetical protein n=1 Tax=Kitasatospora sp. NPDC057692 TaxID=3346215 RepID=UPI00368D3E19
MITVQYELVEPEEIDGEIDIEEDRGSLLLKISRALTPDEIVSALNEASRAVLAGGHWFQEWKGDIIGVDPREGLGDVGRRIPTPRPTLYDVNKPQSGAA